MGHLGMIVLIFLRDRLANSQWESLWKMTEGRRVSKTRYEVPLGDRTVEIDVFKGANTGVITAEVEFPDPATSKAFIPPDWLGEEITRRPEYSNWHLAG